MVRFFLDETEIEQPEGINGFYLERKRDNTFNGFIRQRIASVKGIGEVTLYEKKACDIVRYYFDRYGYDAILPFVIKEGDNIIYIAEVDYGQFSENENGQVSISFRDIDTIGIFDVNVDKVYEIEPIDTITIPKTSLSLGTSHNIEVVNISTTQAPSKKIEIIVPLSVVNVDSVGGGLGISAKDPFKIESFWKNTSIKDIHTLIQGTVYFSCKSDSLDTITVSIIVRQNGINTQSEILYTLQINVGVSNHSIIIDKSIIVPVGGDLLIMIQGENNIQNFEFNFTEGTISITEDLDILSSNVACMSVHNIMSELINICSAGKLNFIDNVFGSSGLFMTNGYCLKNNYIPIKISLTSLFSGLSKIENLSLSIINNSVVLNKKESVYRNAIDTNIDHISNIETIRRTTMSDLFVSEISCGFTEWKSETALGNLEFNSIRIYSTGTKKSKNVINNKITEFIGSGKLIEKQRRMQYLSTQNTVKSDTKLDDSIFIVDTKNGIASIGIYGLNERINPIYQLLNTSFEYGHNDGYFYQTGDGNTSSIIDGLGQSENFETKNNSLLTGKIIMIEGSMELEDYLNIGESVTFTLNDKQVSGIVMEDSFRIGNNTFSLQIIEKIR